MGVQLWGRRARAGICAAGLLVAACLAGHVVAATDEFEVTSSKPEDHLGTLEEVESTLTDELAVKLRQFDEWTVESGLDEAGGARGADVSQGGPGNGAGGGQGGGAPAAGAGSEQVAAKGASAADADAQAAGDIGATGGRAASEEGDGQGAAESDMAGPGDSNGSAGGARQRPVNPPGGGREGVPHEDGADKPGREDDVARMLREAAEEETDPERRQALLEQYEEYMKSR